MAEKNPHLPTRSLEEWTDAELIAEYRRIQAESEEVLGDSREKAPLVRLSEEMRRRGIESKRDDLDTDTTSVQED